MSSPISNTGPSASNKPGRGERLLTLGTARQMVPLVARIVQDILDSRHELALLRPEQVRLDRERRSLDWPERSRRYQLQDRIIAEENRLQGALEELDGLGVILLDPLKGQIGFPTLVNDRRAFFSWKLGEERLNHWHFLGEKVRRRIPASWEEGELVFKKKKGK